MTIWNELFDERTWRVLKEVSGVSRVADGVSVSFDEGRFTIDGGVFQSPLSFNKGKRGALLQEVKDGSDVPGVILAVGDGVLTRVKASGKLT